MAAAWDSGGLCAQPARVCAEAPGHAARGRRRPARRAACAHAGAVRRASDLQGAHACLKYGCRFQVLVAGCILPCNDFAYAHCRGCGVRARAWDYSETLHAHVYLGSCVRVAT